MKYYVIYGEDDEDISEDEEVHQHQEEGEASCMNKKMLKPSPHTQSSPRLPFDVRPQAAGELKFEMLDAHPLASDSDAEDESEAKAKIANSDEKDWLVSICNLKTNIRLQFF